MTNRPLPPPDNPITEAMARNLVAGDYGDVSRQLIASCCLPIYWWKPRSAKLEIVANGTLTLLKTPQRTIGLSAAHVIDECEHALAGGDVRAQIADAVVDDISSRVISRSKELDLISLNIDGLADRFGWVRSPLTSWPPMAPQPGRGIMIGGYPGIERQVKGKLVVSFGLFTVLGIARTISDDQISWLAEREYFVGSSKIPDMPQHADLGGISGGPLITRVQSPGGIETFRLGGIISEAQAELEYVVAKRADFLREDGSF